MYVYCYTNNINGKQYIGITNNPHYRRKTHEHKYRTGYKHPLYDSMRKYGIDNFTFDVLAKAKDREVACKLEQFFISDKNTLYPNGYNLTTGGDGGKEACETTLKLMSDHSLQMWANPEYRNAHSGENSHHYGKRGAETNHFGHQLSDESKAKISEKVKAAWRNPTTRERFMRNHASFKGGQNGHSRAIYQCDKTTHEIIRKWDCITEAAEFIGCSRANINYCCLGKTKSAKGYYWRYVKGVGKNG